jgi:hypothetical protein
MSVDLIVYLKRERLPSAEEWQKAIAAEGIDLAMEKVDTRTHTGFWPLKHENKECGFEYMLDEVDRKFFELEAADDFLELLGDRDCSVTFTWHASHEDGRAAAITAAVLAKLADGVYVDPQSGENAVGVRAFELLARWEQQEQEHKLNEANRKWANSTQRRCPKCGAPCPEYRPRCFVCNFEVGRA